MAPRDYDAEYEKWRNWNTPEGESMRNSITQDQEKERNSGYYISSSGQSSYDPWRKSNNSRDD